MWKCTLENVYSRLVVRDALMVIVEIARLANIKACQEAMLGHLRWKLNKLTVEGRRLEEEAKRNAAIMRTAEEEVCLRVVGRDASNGGVRLSRCLIIYCAIPS